MGGTSINIVSCGSMASGALRALSRPFFFITKGIESAGGLARHPDGKRLMISFGAGGSEAWIATVDAAEVRRALEDADRLPHGASETGGAAGRRNRTTSGPP